MARPVTIVDVARESGVAISSASAALNGQPGVSEATRARVRRVAKELEYVPSQRGRSLASKRAFTIGFVVQSSPDVMSADPFFGAFIAGVQRAITDSGYVMVLQISPSWDLSERLYRRFAAARQVDGVMVDQLRLDDQRIGLVKRLGLPAVAIAPDTVEVPLPMTGQSAVPGFTALVDHLADLGHRDIAHVAGHLDYVHSAERRDTWRTAVAARGLAPGAQIQGDFTVAAGKRAAAEIARLDPIPTAVICVNDLCAIGLMAGLQAHGLEVPGDVSVTGFDGIDLASHVHPSLTTVQTMPEAVGETAASMLLELIEEPGRAPWTVPVPPGPLTLGASTAPPRA
ncbi:MAG: LacI family transcriptional regulator [Bifidobacteriaceae bacterium]|jgi:DNA-binding LacI/PurR family transcriptional regulator|nr:LacI family transcriptional regulator [Bifidobacteriaceae bacterium]